MVVGQTRLPRRQRAGHRRSRPLADRDLAGPARPRARQHRTTHPSPGAAAGAEWTDDEHAALGDLGYEGECTALTTSVKTPAGRRLTADERSVNLLHAATRALAERGNSLLKTTFKALRRVSLRPWRIGAITAAALVLLHHMHDRTT